MKFEERSYSSHLIRPRPTVYLDPNENFILILTAWGAAESLDRVLDNVKQQLLTARQDHELTKTFQNILSLSDEANTLRVATLLTNDLVFRGLNLDQYQVVIESCFINLTQGHVAWSQMGSPHLFLKKKNETPQPLSCFPESRADLKGFPLPVHFLGAEPTISPRCGDLYLDKGDEIIFLSASSIPTKIWTLKDEATLDDWTKALAYDDDVQPFWLGRLQID